MRNKFRVNLVEWGNHWLVKVLLFCTLSESVYYGAEVLSLPGDFSLNRIFLLAVSVLFGLVGVTLFIKDRQNPKWIQDGVRRLRSNPITEMYITTGLWLAAIVLWAIAFLPFTELDRWGALYLRFQPVLRLTFLVSIQSLVVWLFYSFTAYKAEGKDSLKSLSTEGWFFCGLFFFIIVIIAATGWGIGVGTQYWGKTGVPILHWQIGLSLGVALGGFLIFSRKLPNSQANIKIDIGVFILLWLSAFIAWQAVPIAVSRFTTAQYPPNFVSYPYSDAGDYLLSAQSIWLGNGFQYGYIDKPLHLTILALISLLTGGNFNNIIILQVAILSVIPGLIYLLATQMTNRPAGFMAGLVILFMQSNSLAAINRIQVSNVKMMLSEPLTQLMILLVCLAVVHWWKHPHGGWVNPALAGALLGLAGLTRLNALLVAPFIAGGWLLFFGLYKKRVWLSTLVFAVFCALPFIPWMVRNQVILHNPLEFVASKTYGVLYKNRFKPIYDEQTTDAQSIPETPPTSESEGDKITPQGVAGLSLPMLDTGFHNLVTVGMVLPASVIHNGLDETIRQPYWDSEWDGTFTPGGFFVFALSLLFVAIGAASAWRKNRALASLLLLVLTGYLLSNTISLVSGGRYIVPVDWVLPVFYSLGLMALVLWILGIPVYGYENIDLESDLPSVSKKQTRSAYMLTIVLIISILPAGFSLFIPRKYLPTRTDVSLTLISNNYPQVNERFLLEDFEKFSQNENAIITRGLAMYPRWMKTGESDTGGTGSAFSAQPFDHLSFTILDDSDYPLDVMLPFNKPINFLPNAAEVVVFGCRQETYIDAAAVFLIGEKSPSYFRPDISRLECPLPNP